MSFIFKAAKHFCIINRHKWEVFKACVRAGLYWQAITHDLSKYLPSEFIEYAHYYNGKISPVDKAKEVKGYCYAWLHHRGRNPHHYEYWIDNLDGGGNPIAMPYKYAMEMACDYIGAGKAYNPQGWTIAEPLKYWDNKKKTAKIAAPTVRFLDAIFLEFSKVGHACLKKKAALKIYKQAFLGLKNE